MYNSPVPQDAIEDSNVTDYKQRKCMWTNKKKILNSIWKD